MWNGIQWKTLESSYNVRPREEGGGDISVMRWSFIPHQREMSLEGIGPYHVKIPWEEHCMET